jgi:hypothetical protein
MCHKGGLQRHISAEALFERPERGWMLDPNARSAVCEMWYWYGQSDNGLLAITRFCTQIMRVWRPSAPSHTDSTIFSPSLSWWQRAVTFFCVIAIPHLLRAGCHAISFSCAVSFYTLKSLVFVMHEELFTHCAYISEFSPGSRRRPCW